MSWNPYYPTGYAPPQTLNGSFMGGGGYQIPPEALPYLSAEQIQMLGGSNQQNPVDAFVQSLPPEIQSNPTSILQAASSDPSLAQAVIEKYDIPDAGSMTFENPYRNPLSDALLQAAKDVLIPYGATMGASALFGVGGGAGGAGAAAAGDGLSPITVGQSMLPGGTGAGVSAVQGALAGAPLAAFPAALSTPAGISAFTGAGAAGAAGNALQDMAAVPSANNPTAGPIPGEEWWRNIVGNLGPALSGMTAPGGYGGGGQDNAGLMQMMSALLQRQRQPVPQVQMGARYKPYG